jgi:sugar/nucleoside kinase (ribokinase family)
MKDVSELLAIGNIYLETNYLALESGGSESLSAGHEYRSDRYETKLGGSVVNFILQLKKLGVGKLGLIGKIGDDEAGEKVLDLLNRAGISSEYITHSPRVQTAIDTGVILSHNHDNIQLVSGNANQNLSYDDLEPKMEMLVHAKVIYLGGFFKQESLFESYPFLLRKLKSQGIRLFLDHGRLPVNIAKQKLETLRAISPFIEGYFPNHDELLSVTEEADTDSALRKALSWGFKFVAVKLGASGCKVYSNSGLVSVSGYQINVVNVVGAGDSFNAGFIFRLLYGKSPNLVDCAEFANAVAAFRVSRNYLPNKAEVEDLLQTRK